MRIKHDWEKDLKNDSATRFYHLHRRLDQRPAWFFGVRQNQIASRPKEGYLVLHCDINSPNEKVFEIPYLKLREILSGTRPNLKGDYKLHINKEYPFEFNWGNMLKMDGTQFWVWGSREGSGRDR